ncbi:MAG TPA: hypothetical protein ENJ87_00765 [Gammaproteobacteria bacterium]|nr:hypothetical protein [Gammaproteobacteria bacterium]
MEEDEYKSSYDELASIRCVFEKALTSHQAKCTSSTHFCLADREGYSCADIPSSAKCREILELLRKKSVFALKLREIASPLPHNMEIRVQLGGLRGLVKLFDEKMLRESSLAHPGQERVDDIQAVIKRAVEKYGSLHSLPYSQIIQSVVSFQGRQKRQH